MYCTMNGARRLYHGEGESILQIMAEILSVFPLWMVGGRPLIVSATCPLF